MYDFQNVGLFRLVLQKDSDVIEIAAHKKTVKATEDGLVSEEDDIEMRCVVHEFDLRQYDLVPEVIAALADF